MASAIVRQFGRPTGLLGRLAGLIMLARPSNRERNLRTLELLEVEPVDRVLEIGFGPGFAVARAAELASRGKVVGVDHSELMLRTARRRNREAMAAGRVELHLGSAESLPPFAAPFDKVFAVNVFMFWRDPRVVLAGLRRIMRPGGVIALTFQPRRRGATGEDTRRGAERILLALGEAGFDGPRIEILHVRPVDAACVIARAPGPS